MAIADAGLHGLNRRLDKHLEDSYIRDH